MGCGCDVLYNERLIVYCPMHQSARETLELLSDVSNCAIGLEGADHDGAHDELYSDDGILDQAVKLLAAMQEAGALAMPDAQSH